jgi:CRP-like cAMP-binding protein
MIHNYFSNFNLFSETEINDLVQLFVPRQLNKNELFIREGDTCKEVAFIESGIFRSYYASDNGVENTFCFRFSNHLLAPYSAFVTGNPSLETMQAVTNAKLLVIKTKDIERLVEKNSNWIKLLKLNAEYEYIELEKRFFQLQKDSATQRYLSLVKNQPEYIQQIPLQYLASYLGVTQRHLSRIRKEISF